MLAQADTGTQVQIPNFHQKGFLYIHRAMRNDLAAFEKVVYNLTADDDMSALAQWFNFFWAMVQEHHTAEDELVFPIVAQRSALFSYHLKIMTAQHQQIHRLVEEIGAIFIDLNRASFQHDRIAAFRLLQRLVTSLWRELSNHLDREEAVYMPELARHFRREEQIEIEEKLQARLPKEHMERALPWILSGLYDDERAEMLASLPFTVRMLYKLSWRNKYERFTAVLKLPEFQSEPVIP
jgi:iron-sulfur cluster repair protein YtfE (RIC family)